MIFSMTYPQVISGQKTATRRIGETCRYTGGNRYLVQEKRGVKGTHYIKVQNTYKQRLGDMTEVDALEEGVQNLAEFKRIWQSLHGEWNDDLVVWVIKFELVGKRSVVDAEDARYRREKENARYGGRISARWNFK